MGTDSEKAAREGREAVGKTWRDCPYGHDMQELREAWCAARLEADEQARPLVQRSLFGKNILAVTVGWLLFFGAIAIVYKVFELVLGQVDEFGRTY